MVSDYSSDSVSSHQNDANINNKRDASPFGYYIPVESVVEAWAIVVEDTISEVVVVETSSVVSGKVVVEVTSVLSRTVVDNVVEASVVLSSTVVDTVVDPSTVLSGTVVDTVVDSFTVVSGMLVDVVGLFVVLVVVDSTPTRKPYICRVISIYRII